MKLAAIYARVSSDKQREEHTIASQTAALIEFAKKSGLEVPKEWVFEDEGYSGAKLERPGLERVRDLAAEGQIQAVLVYAPDRLSRKYTHQMLLMDEFARHGVETRFVKAPKGDTPEDQLALQFQGMIAEYERAQTMERSRRGKRHRAKSGEVSVMSAAPYGYLYVRKADDAPAEWRVLESEARVVRRIYRMYTVDSLSIGDITRRLNIDGIPTRRRAARWADTTVWKILKNTAYRGTAAFGKTRTADRQRVTRATRRSGIAPSSETVARRPREEWIEIPVPPLVSEEVFAQAQERMQQNKAMSKRHTRVPSVVQGLVICRKCGYALCRSTVHRRTHTLHYYKCAGSDAWRKLSGPLCTNRRCIRQELLDETVWLEVVRLLENPTLIQQELDRRLQAARAADPAKNRQETLQRELARVANSIERLLSAYQEQLLSIEQLRDRMPSLRQRDQALRAELQAIADQARDRDAFLRLAETLTSFLARLRTSANTLDVLERQRIVRLVVKEILVDEDTIVIRHCIPVASPPPGPAGGRNPGRQAKTPAEEGSPLHYRGAFLGLSNHRSKRDDTCAPGLRPVTTLTLSTRACPVARTFFAAFTSRS
jgi:site-specific DNA recombinase